MSGSSIFDGIDALAHRRAEAMLVAQELANKEGRPITGFTYGRAWHLIPADRTTTLAFAVTDSFTCHPDAGSP